MRDLLIASTNKNKIREINEKFADLPFNVIGLEKITANGKFPDLKEVKEDGDSFTENALKKARKRARITGLLTIADDSGLVVDYLKGRPGIYSSRFAGPEASDEDNNKKLLEKLEGVPDHKRGARFKCVIAIVDPIKGREITVEGICKGKILTEERGENGFGYDPLFFLPQYGKTMAEITMEEKNKISHRARALVKAGDILSNFF